MLAYIEGRVLERSESSCVLLTVSGVGYEIFAPEPTLLSLPIKGETAGLYTCFVVREDAQELFGFSTWDERQTFILLTGINRVGARTALSILSSYRPDDLRRMVAQDDGTALTKVSGIGKKTAQQIFLELKYKMKASASSFDGASAIVTQGASSAFRDTLAGLVRMGFDEERAEGVLTRLVADDPDMDEKKLLSRAFKILGGGK
ncbi:MAG: Holliday junction branch migration protein RuvA [Mailhella sp.]|nr:Holliday junction branch migration protein RuvA [Mailhella sp.]